MIAENFLVTVDSGAAGEYTNPTTETICVFLRHTRNVRHTHARTHLLLTAYACRAWMLPQQLFSYEKFREKYSNASKKRRGYSEGIWEIEEDPDLMICKLSHLIRLKKTRSRSSEVRYKIVHNVIFVFT